MAVRHVMSDGTRRDSIEGYIVPKDSPVYGVIRKAYEEGVISADEATKEIDKRSKELLAIVGENPKEWLCEIQDQYISVFVKKNAPEEKITLHR